ncbi:hypothetical protein BCM02_11723 [Paenibacillus methanolicus]|uniref:Uncharacterized protein n=1 Tax=Paenibacillus methanolicus TaxID=582686 RepID=A0A5S5BNY7_9BACL|nr:hypothetical protein BCM02_11723 [Paenibacillus methanolicus]
MNWHKAKMRQLYEIAFLDPEAAPWHKEGAKAEIVRRIRRKYKRINFKARKVYPR